MNELNPLQKEEIARQWCSKKHNMELAKTLVLFWDSDGMMYPFEFDIASHPRRKEIEELEEELKKHEEEHGKIKDLWNDQYSFEHIIKAADLRGWSPDIPDNREVVGMVKSGKHDNSCNTFHSILGDCFLLTKAKANNKYMILTDREMHDYVRERCTGLLDEIELVHLDVDKNRDLLNDA